MEYTILKCIIGFTIILSAISLIYFKQKIAAYILLNSFSLVLILSFTSQSVHELYPEYSGVLVYSGLIFFPLTFTLLLLIFFDKGNTNSFIKAAVLYIPFIMLISLLHESPVLIIAFLHIANSIFVLSVIFSSRHSIISRIFIALVSTNIILISISVMAMKAGIHGLIISVVITAALSHILLAADFFIRVKSRFSQVDDMNEVIMKLNHHIARLNQSSDQIKKIISEKDIEILQASRHASLGEITTGIAHELAQPLTGIKIIAQNLIDDITYDEFSRMEAGSELLKICSLVDKSTSIINHIRNFSKKSGFSMRLVDINKAVLNAIDLINQQLKGKGIEVVFLLDDNIPGMIGDNLSLEQLIVNILLNAKDAIVDKKKNLPDISGMITISTSYNSGRIKMVIADNGIGIPREILPKIWSPFFTSKKSSHGTGIGLSISKKILKAHNAEIDLKSDDTGTTFTFSFPAHEEFNS